MCGSSASVAESVVANRDVRPFAHISDLTVASSAIVQLICGCLATIGALNTIAGDNGGQTSSAVMPYGRLRNTASSLALLEAGEQDKTLPLKPMEVEERLVAISAVQG